MFLEEVIVSIFVVQFDIVQSIQISIYDDQQNIH